MKCTLGTGILALPRAYSNTGWLLGLAGSVLISCLLLYAMHVLVVFEYNMHDLIALTPSCTIQLNDINLTRKRYKMATLSYSEAMHLALLNGPTWIRPLSKYFA